MLRAIQNALESNGQSLKEKDILVVASKVFSYSERRLVEVGNSKQDTGHRTQDTENSKQTQNLSFQEIVRGEADRVFGEGDMVITLKNKILIPNAGIDNSNTPKGTVILWPKDPFGSARAFQSKLKSKFGLKKLGIVISDSHCQPLRSGTTGITIGWAGFEGVQDVRGKKDLYGKKMTYTQIAVADDLASAANILMGETDASMPFVIVRDAPVKFTEKKFSEKDYFISPKECIYTGFYSDDLKKRF